MARPKLLLAEPDGFSARAVALLQTRFDVEQRKIDAGSLAAALDGYDVVWVRLAHRLTSDVVASASRCRTVVCPVTGLDHIDLKACEAKGIRVISLKGETEFLRSVRATAELSMGLALALMRRVPAAAASVKDGRWRRDDFRGHELYEKTAGIIGLGRLGSIVAGYCSAFGMRVVGFDPAPTQVPGVERLASLDAVLGAADLVSVHVSYDASTHHLLGKREFAATKRGAFLVNTSRGGVVDEVAMLDALREGRLAGAALDVLSGEPGVDATHPVVRYAREHENCLVVPHIGGNTFESFEKTEMFIARKVVESLS